MMDLEKRLRASLQERADDVEPTPELWRMVERKAARRRALPVFVWVAAGAAATITAVAVLPGILDGAESRFTIDPAQPPTAVAPTVPDGQVAGVATPTHQVAIVGSRLVLRAVDGSGETVLAELAAEGESTLRTLAVRPGSSPSDLTVAYVTSGEGMFDLRLVRMGPDGDVSTSVVAANLSPTIASDETVAPTIAWSPDGRTMAWAAPNADGRPALFLMDLQAHLDNLEQGFAPGTPMEVALRGADEDARIRLDACAASAGTCGQLRLQAWGQGPEAGELAFTSEGLLLRASIRRVEDGWTVAEGDGETGVAVDTAVSGYVVDVAVGPDGQEYVLTAGGGTSQDAEDANLQLHLGEQSVGIDLATASPVDVWMTAVPSGAIVGLGNEVRVVSAVDDGMVVGLGPASDYAAYVPVSGAAPATPPGTGTGTEAGPSASGPLSASGVTPYLQIDQAGRVVLVEGDGGELSTLFDPASEPGADPTPMDLAVQPGSTPDDLTAVVLVATEGGPELRTLRHGPDGTTFEPIPGPLGLGGDAMFSSLQVPVWSPDGRHLAWAEQGSDGSWTLRTIGWDGGPGTGRPADDNASFGLDIGSSDVAITDWVWDTEGADGTAQGGLLLVYGRDADGGDGVGATRLPIERQGDGALAVTGQTGAVDDSGLLGGIEVAAAPDGRIGQLVRLDDGGVALVVDPAAGDTPVPFPASVSSRDLDLDALGQGIWVVTDRRSGLAYVVDAAGEAAPLEADAATTHGYDRVD